MKYFVLFFLLSFGIYAQNEYGFLKNNPSNLRVGPGKRFPIIWVYQQKNLPVKIIDTYPDWYKIEDKWGQTGWVAKQNISTQKKMAMTNDDGEVLMYKKANKKSPLNAILKGRFILTVKKCDRDFCFVEIPNYKGYILRQDLWGDV